MIVLDGLRCIIDGRRVKATAALRPSDASLLVFEQVRTFVRRRFSTRGRADFFFSDNLKLFEMFHYDIDVELARRG